MNKMGAVLRLIQQRVELRKVLQKHGKFYELERRLGH